MFYLALFLTVVLGVLFGLQGPTNSALGRRVGVFESSLVSFGGGMIIMSIVVAIFGHGDLSLFFTAKWWMMLGGLYGMLSVSIYSYASPKLGMALVFMLSMFGQVIAGLFIDGLGLMGSTKIPITLLRIIGILVFSVGIYLVYKGNLEQEAAGERKIELIPSLLSVFCGVIGAIQSPTNVAMANIVGQKEGTLVNFMVGFASALVILLIKNKGRLPKYRGFGVKPWMCTGGAYGAAGVSINIFTTPILGVSLLVVGITLGQLGTGMLVDTMGLLDAKKIGVNRDRLIGLAVIFVGMCVVTFAK